MNPAALAEYFIMRSRSAGKSDAGLGFLDDVVERQVPNWTSRSPKKLSRTGFGHRGHFKAKIQGQQPVICRHWRYTAKLTTLEAYAVRFITIV